MPKSSKHPEAPLGICLLSLRKENRVDLSQPSRGNRRHIHPFPWVLKLWTVKDFGLPQAQCGCIFANERPPANFLEMLAWSFSTLMCILYCLSWACQLCYLLDSLCKLWSEHEVSRKSKMESKSCFSEYMDSVIISEFLHSAFDLSSSKGATLKQERCLKRKILNQDQELSADSNRAKVINTPGSSGKPESWCVTLDCFLMAHTIIKGKSIERVFGDFLRNSR